MDSCIQVEDIEGLLTQMILDGLVDGKIDQIEKVLILSREGKGGTGTAVHAKFLALDQVCARLVCVCVCVCVCPANMLSTSPSNSGRKT